MLQSPVIIITGASKGIGKAVTLSALNKFNARVVAIARSEALLTQLQQEVATDNLEIVVGDVTDDSICKKAVDRAIDRWGQLDSVIANAG
jgi:NADP-dependent 3-hydroxy acid dehydrogenase YdfG